MNKLFDVIINLSDLDDLAIGDSVVHKTHSIVKLFTSLSFITCVLSTVSVIELIMYFILILLISKISNITTSRLIKRGLLGLPLSLCLGISFLIFNQHEIYFYGMIVREGAILCILVFLKTFLCLCSVYILISTTSFDDLASELVFLHVPSLFVLQLTMTYRYIFVLLKEAQNMSKAYLLKSPYSKAIEMKDMGSFVGRLLVSSMNQSVHIYDCMKCRGFQIETTYQKHQKIRVDQIYLLLMMLSLLVLIKVVCP